jgi:flagellar assembly protein FliH
LKKDYSKIPPEQLTAYERWELPVMGESPKKGKPPDIKLPTAAELQAIQKAAYDEGFQQGKTAGTKAGYDEGHKQGLQAGKEEGIHTGIEQGRNSALAENQAKISQHLQQLQQITSSLEYPLKEIQENTEEAIVNLVLAISRAVIFRDLKLDRTHIVNVVSEALAALPVNEEQAIVYIHPEDAQVLRSYLPADKDFRYLLDAKVMAGGCRVETRHTLLDFTVEKRFQTVVQQMLAGQNNTQEIPDTHDFTEQMGAMSDFHREVLESSPEDNSDQVDEDLSTGEATKNSGDSVNSANDIAESIESIESIESMKSTESTKSIESAKNKEREDVRSELTTTRTSAKNVASSGDAPNGCRTLLKSERELTEEASAKTDNIVSGSATNTDESLDE